MFKKALLFLLCISFFCCATIAVQDNAAEKAVFNLVNSLNSDTIEIVTGKIMHPFLLDTEIILIKQDIKTFWQDYIKAGPVFVNPEIVSIKKVETMDYTEFGISMDIELFFKKYVPAAGYLVKLRSKNRYYLLIIKPGKDSLPAFYGFKGPFL